MTDDTAIEIMATGLRFPEGPIAMADGSVVLVEIARQTLSRVNPDGSVEVIAHLGGGPNGAAIGPDGKVYVCNNGGMKFHEARGKTYPGHMPDGYTGGSIQRVDLDTGEFEVLYTHAGDVQLRGPNDLVFDRDGGFWFTDHGKLQDRLQDRTGVFYAKADGSHIQEMIFPMEGPNGIGLSPAEDEVYIAETPTGQVWAYELAGPGELLGQRRDKPDGGRLLGGRDGYFMFDSLAIDADGSVHYGPGGETEFAGSCAFDSICKAADAPRWQVQAQDWNPAELAPGGRTTLAISFQKLRRSSICHASHVGIPEDTFMILAVTAGEGVARVFLKNEEEETEVDVPAGTLSVACLIDVVDV